MKNTKHKLPFFYGWIILGIGILGMAMSIPGQTIGVSVFTDDLIKVLDLSRVNISLAYMIGTIASALILTPAGKLLDKQGERRMGTIVTGLLGLLLVTMSRLDKTLDFLYSNIGASKFIIAFILIAVTFFLLRFLGQGMLTLISRNMVMKWFDKYRGMANAIFGIFSSFIFALAPRILNDLIGQGGWNGAWMRLGIFLAIAGVLLFWFLGRDTPEKYGMKPDGKLNFASSRKRPAGKPRKDFTLEQARKTLPFWSFGLTLAIHSLFVTAFTFHVVSIFENAGMSRTDAVAIFLPASFISVGVNFSVSFISDYIKLRYILMLHVIALALTMFFLSRLAPGFNLIMFTIGYGTVNGLLNISASIVWPRYYGTTNLGAITGMIMGFTVAGSAIGPYFFSLIFTSTNSYSIASLICLAVTIVLFIFAFFVRRPVHPDLR